MSASSRSSLEMSRRVSGRSNDEVREWKEGGGELGVEGDRASSSCVLTWMKTLATRNACEFDNGTQTRS